MTRYNKTTDTVESIINVIRKSIDKLLESKETIIIAIDGKSGSGKTTLADKLGEYYDLNILKMDDFFLPQELRTKKRLNETGGNVDYIRFKEEVINKLLKGNDFKYRVFDCKTMKLTDLRDVKTRSINIIEGSYSLHPSLIENYDLKIFLDIDGDSQRERILKRNGVVILKRFLEEWIPKENKYFDEMQIREKSDLYFNIDI